MILAGSLNNDNITPIQNFSFLDASRKLKPRLLYCGSINCLQSSSFMTTLGGLLAASKILRFGEII